MTSTLTRGAPTAAVPRPRGSSFATQVAVLTSRSLMTSVRDPQMILFSLLQPAVLLFMFTQVFAVMATTSSFPPGITYIDYLMPAILLNNAVQQAMQSGVGLVEDLKNGFLARLRSMPIHRSAPLVARSFADLAYCALQLVALLLAAVAVFGYRPGGGFLGGVISVALALLVSYGLSWVFLALGAWLRRAQTMQNISIVAVFPLMFVSSAYVPLAALPDWLRAVAQANPLTYAVDTIRSIALGMPGGGFSAAATTLLISATLAALGALAATHFFRRPF
ncbi:ABC transporter permease [Amycolatopsis rhabdoformis]|uniref:Transport permease protein n=1 Tax=Amycolatopsis rhabdoformis TaxID=1448059 RepID=A0ABZ1IEM1_9PSEU|nr:ABC transporter permease [Amycolatopsis rhabdoformis]WSE32924.1 ABC transporter permease [Amycolatopsis rhabdoformis]